AAGSKPEVGRARELLEELDDGPVRDSFAVGEAAPAHDGRVLERADELGRQARLADAGDAEDREKLAGAVVDCLRERLPQAAQLAGAADERRGGPARERGSLVGQ